MNITHYKTLRTSGSIIAASLTFLGLLLCRGLGGHVDGCSSHGDGAPAGHQVELHSLPGDEGGRHLHLFGQTQVGAEAGHEVSGGDEVHAGLQRLQDELETPANLLLGDPGDGADLCGEEDKVRSEARRNVSFNSLLNVYCNFYGQIREEKVRQTCVLYFYI